MSARNKLKYDLNTPQTVTAALGRTFGIEVNDSRVRSDPVIPENDRARRPADTGLKVNASRNVVAANQHVETTAVSDSLKEVQDGIRLIGFETDDSSRELFVDVQGLFACQRVYADQWVDVFNRLPLDDTAAVAFAREFGLFDTRVHDRQRLEILPERR